MMKGRGVQVRRMTFVHNPVFGLSGFVLLILAGTSAAHQSNPVSFHDIVSEPGSGINYRRTESPSDALLDAMKQKASFDMFQDGPLVPVKPRGAPGVAVFDYDSDGDLDIYVTNGPGTANSLYANQLNQNGHVHFEEVAVAAQVTAIEQDSTGVCFGDIDNDGDPDLLVLGNGMGNLLYENQGGGVFKDISIVSGIGGMEKHPSSCSMGDVNGDGLLDVAIANTFNNWTHRLPLQTLEYDFLNEENQLFLNEGNNLFLDVTATSGIGVSKHITWAISLVDYDQDGDLDLINADDQGTVPPAFAGGRDRGFVRIYRNNGKGEFEDVTNISGTNRIGAWMGVTFADFDHNSHLDMFVTNVGYYMPEMMSGLLGFPVNAGDWESGWFLGHSDNVLTFPGIGDLITSPFGWGASAFDYDNDGDTDIIFHGGQNMGPFLDGTNPGAILQNNGAAQFSYDSGALANSTNHSRRNVQGMAIGDLNNDGFTDIVSVSSENWPEPFPLAPYLPPTGLLGSPFDQGAYLWPSFFPFDPTNLTLGFTWSGFEPENGTLSVELSSGSNQNRWAKIKLQGSVGILPDGRVNRDGIGAVMHFTPKGGKTAVLPVLGGASYASQDSLESVFGMGRAKNGMLEILWPGGVRNRLYNVQAEERIIVPEIPCSYDTQLLRHEYSQCVRQALHELREKDVLSKRETKRYMASAMRAYNELHSQKDEGKDNDTHSQKDEGKDNDTHSQKDEGKDNKSHSQDDEDMSASLGE